MFEMFTVGWHSLTQYTVLGIVVVFLRILHLVFYGVSSSGPFLRGQSRFWAKKMENSICSYPIHLNNIGSQFLLTFFGHAYRHVYRCTIRTTYPLVWNSRFLPNFRRLVSWPYEQVVCTVWSACTERYRALYKSYFLPYQNAPLGIWGLMHI